VVIGRGQPAPSPPARGSGSAVSFPSVVRGGACILCLQTASLGTSVRAACITVCVLQIHDLPRTVIREICVPCVPLKIIDYKNNKSNRITLHELVLENSTLPMDSAMSIHRNMLGLQVQRQGVPFDLQSLRGPIAVSSSNAVVRPSVGLDIAYKAVAASCLRLLPLQRPCPSPHWDRQTDCVIACGLERAA